MQELLDRLTATGYDQPVLAGVAAGAVLLVVLLARGLFDRRKAAVDRRLATGDDDSSVSLQSLADPDARKGSIDRFDDWFNTAVARTGLDASPAGVLGVMALLAVAAGAGLYYWKGSIGFAMLGVLFGFLVPFLFVLLLQGRHRTKLQAQLPDALSMMAGSLRGGQTMEQAIEFVARQGAKPLSTELGAAAAQLKLGVTPETALKTTAKRVNLPDFDILVSTVGLHRQTGGNLALLVDRLAGSVRDRNQFRGAFLAATAQGRAVAVAIGLAGPLLLLGYLLFDPEHVQGFLNSPNGWATLAICAAVQLFGILWLWRILKVDY